jgi:hypothetical protein
MKNLKYNIINFFKKIKDSLVSSFQIADEVARLKAVEGAEAELEELEYVFAILVQGSFIGMPSPPVQISLDLLPFMEEEMVLLLEKINTSNEPLSRLFSTFDIG